VHRRSRAGRGDTGTADGPPPGHRSHPSGGERRRARSAAPRRPATAPAAQQRVERAPEVGIEHVVDDRVEHGAAVGDPLEGDEHTRWEVRPARLAAGALDDVDGEERKIAGDEHHEQDTKHLSPARHNFIAL